MSYNGPDYPQGPQQPQQPPYPGAPYSPGGQPGESYPAAGGYPDGTAQPNPYGQGAQPYSGAQPYPGAQPYANPAGYGGGGWNQAPLPQKTGLAITALILGIAAFLFSVVWFFSIPVGIAGLVVGILALMGNKKGTQGGKGLALTGVIGSGIGFLVGVVMLIVFGATMVWAQGQVDPLPTADTSPSATVTTEASPSPSASATNENLTFTPKPVNETWTDPGTQDVVEVHEFFLGGPSPEDSNANLLAVRMTFTSGEIYTPSDVVAYELKPEAAEWPEYAYTTVLDEDEAAEMITKYGLDGPALAPYASLDEDPLTGWVFYEVPDDAAGAWTLNFTRDGFTVRDNDQKVEAATMNISLGEG